MINAEKDVKVVVVVQFMNSIKAETVTQNRSELISKSNMIALPSPSLAFTSISGQQLEFTLVSIHLVSLLIETSHSELPPPLPCQD